jgi:hypothetical protein
MIDNRRIGSILHIIFVTCWTLSASFHKTKSFFKERFLGIAYIMREEIYQRDRTRNSWFCKGRVLIVLLSAFWMHDLEKSGQAMALQEDPSICTMVISPDGNDADDGSLEYPYQTIQKAAEVSQPGDVICVREGTYHEFNVMFLNSGTAENPITMRNYPGENPVLDGGQLLDNWHLYSDDVFYTEDFDQSHDVAMVTEDESMLLYDHEATPENLIQGGMLRDGNRIYIRPYAGMVEGHTFVLIYRPSAFIFRSTSHIVLEGLTYKHYNNETISSDENSHHITVRECVFKNNVRTALHFDGDFILVENCDISWSGVFGLIFTGEHSVARGCTASYVTNAFYATDGAHDILFEDCEASHFARRGIPNTSFRGDGDAIGIGPSTDVVVRNGHFYDSGNDFPISDPEEQSGCAFDIWKGDRFTIDGNVIHDVHSSFVVAPGRNGIIQNNLIYDVNGNGISFWGSVENPGYNNKVYNNTIYGCGNSGIHISPNTTDVEVKNNIVMNCDGYEFSVTEKDGNLEDYNLFYDEATDYVISWLGNAKTLSQYQQESNLGKNSIGENPLFQDVATNDFHLKTESPAIDIGTILVEVTTDIEGKPRPQGTGYDIGAYETVLTPTFADVPLDHWAHDYIEALYQEGYVAGCNLDPLMYCPNVAMNRAESAVFIERGIHGAETLPAPPAVQIFADVPLTEWFAKWSTALWNDGYTAGCGTNPLIYCPLQGHTRAEGSVFFLRMMHGADYVPPEPTGIFADVPITTWYADWAEAAYNAGIIPACQTEPALLFCPEDSLDRAMAAYMMVQAKGLQVP